jgi:hypothetical protein
MTFTNVSEAPETSAVFKTIFVDLADDDTGEAVLWDAVIRGDLSDGSYTVGSYNVLPGYNPLISDGESMMELNADNPAPHNGIKPGGEKLVVEFQTSLPDGAGTADYLSFFGGGEDTAAYTLGFHAISTDTMNGGSLTGANVPEPTVLAMIAAGAGLLLRRRR